MGVIKHLENELNPVKFFNYCFSAATCQPVGRTTVLWIHVQNRSSMESHKNSNSEVKVMLLFSL